MLQGLNKDGLPFESISVLFTFNTFSTRKLPVQSSLTTTQPKDKRCAKGVSGDLLSDLKRDGHLQHLDPTGEVFQHYHQTKTTDQQYKSIARNVLYHQVYKFHA